MQGQNSQEIFGILSQIPGIHNYNGDQNHRCSQNKTKESPSRMTDAHN